MRTVPPSPLMLAGPTAVGKSAVALRLAELLPGEIVTVDSMQVYRGMDIGTAKPTPAERARVPHHLLDVVGVTEPFDAAQFIERAQVAVGDITRRGKTPIFCGGTGLYFKAWLEGLGHSPASDPQLRAELERTPLPDLLAELSAKDPVTYERIDRQNPRRIFRAVEVLRLTGRPFSEQRAKWPADAVAASPLFGLSRPAADLQARINQRVDEMFAQGLVEETRQLLAAGLEQNRNALQALGYRQVVEHLRGEHTLAETIELVKSRTRKFAKRQWTWFRGQLPVQWIEWPPERSAEEIAYLILQRRESR